MIDPCSNYRIHIPDAAEGRADLDVMNHVATCAKCAKLLTQHRVLLAAASGTWESPSAQILARVKGLMPETRRILVGRRIFAPSLSAARGLPVEEFQVLVGAEDVSVRIMATPQGEGWSIMGRLPNDSWAVQADSLVDQSAGRFQLDASDLNASGFDLLGPDVVIRIPALSELLTDDSY